MIPAVSLSSSFRLCNCKAQKYMMHPWDQIQSIKGKCMQHGMVMPDWSIVLQLTNLRGTGHMRSEERVSSLIRRLPMTAGSMRCPGHSPLSACKQCTTILPCVYLHPLVCRKPFRRHGCKSRCSSGRKTSRALRTPVQAKVASFAEPEPYLVRIDCASGQQGCSGHSAVTPFQSLIVHYAAGSRIQSREQRSVLDNSPSIGHKTDHRNWQVLYVLCMM